MLDRHEHTALAHKIAEITKNLVSDKYRNNPDFIEDEEHGVDISEKGELPEGVKKNYFEVLFVEDISVQEENKLRSDLKAIRGPTNNSVMVSWCSGLLKMH